MRTNMHVRELDNYLKKHETKFLEEIEIDDNVTAVLGDTSRYGSGIIVRYKNQVIAQLHDFSVFIARTDEISTPHLLEILNTILKDNDIPWNIVRQTPRFWIIRTDTNDESVAFYNATFEMASGYWIMTRLNDGIV